MLHKQGKDEGHAPSSLSNLNLAKQESKLLGRIHSR